MVIVMMAFKLLAAMKGQSGGGLWLWALGASVLTKINQIMMHLCIHCNWRLGGGVRSSRCCAVLELGFSLSKGNLLRTTTTNYSSCSSTTLGIKALKPKWAERDRGSWGSGEHKRKRRARKRDKEEEEERWVVFWFQDCCKFFFMLYLCGYVVIVAVVVVVV